MTTSDDEHTDDEHTDMPADMPAAEAPACRYCLDGPGLTFYDPPCPMCSPRADIDAYLHDGEDLEHAHWNAGQQTASLLDQLLTPEPGIGRS